LNVEPPETSQQQPPVYTREQWRDMRRAQRRGYWTGRWSLFWGVVLVVAGTYALLHALRIVPDIRADVVFPVLVIGLGVWLIIDRASPRRPPGT
jgi:hypothetical protein